ncbi:MAG: DNA alkylation repair protein [Colwellia sp.]|nr:DNA alkylation repair protein [Colwellia sp.]
MELMKNGLAEPAIKRIAFALSKVLPNFSSEDFIALSLVNIEQLELKERVQHLITVIHTFMPSNFPQAAQLLIDIKPYWDFGEKDDALSSFAAWPIIDYIAEFGLDHPVESLTALKELTELFSAEFAIRPFIIKHTEYCHQQFELWVGDKNEHVRRLVSEGTRPRLPWGIQLKQFINAPSPNIPLLSKLYQDKSLYVRRSVANHLNDIAKDNPDVVIKTCELWQENSIDQINTQWVIKHATRSLIKSGNQAAFSLLGFTKKPLIKLSSINLSNTNVAIGKTLNFDFELISSAKKTQNLVIDFAIHFMKANQKQRAKVFKLKTITLKANEKLTLNKKHSFKIITTRKYYPGEHLIEILINGKSYRKQSFILTKSI